jgi:hypothetical protein
MNALDIIIKNKLWSLLKELGENYVKEKITKEDSFNIVYITKCLNFHRG